MQRTALATEEFFNRLLEFEAEGWNIYVCMNPFPKGTARRMEAYVDVVRNLFIESDGEKDTLALLKHSSDEDGDVPAPHSILESSPGKYHIVWSVEGFTPATAKPMLKSLAAKFGGDPQATDLHRVLRMPGFRNLKYSDKPATRLIASRFGDQPDTAYAFNLPVEVAKPKAPAMASDKLATIIDRFIANFEKGGIILGNEQEHSGGVKFVIDCPWAEEHTTSGSTAAVFVMADGSMQFNCFHAHCANRGWSDIRQLLEAKAGKLDFAEPTVLIGGKLPSTEPTPAPQMASATTATQGGLEWNWQPITPIEDAHSAVKPFDLEALPFSLRPFVEDTAALVGVPLDYVGVSLVIAMSGASGRRMFVYPAAKNKTWKEPFGGLSGFLVGNSGSKKSPSQKPIVNILAEKDATWDAEYKARKAQYDAQVKAYEASLRKTKAPSSMFLPPAPPAPARRVLTGRATPEAVHKIEADCPEGVVSYFDELVVFFDQFGKQGHEDDRSSAMESLGGDSIQNHDTISRGRVSARSCRTILASTQPDTCKNLLAKQFSLSDGFVQRFPLVCWPDLRVVDRDDRMPNDQAKEVIRRAFNTILELRAEVGFYHFDPEAQVMFNELEQRANHVVRTLGSSNKASFIGKSPAFVARLAGVFQAFELAAEGKDPSGTRQIDKQHLAMALKFFDYIQTHADRLYSWMMSDHKRTEYVIASHLQAGHLTDGFTVRDVMRKCWSGIVNNAAVIDGALANLQEKEWLGEHQTAGSGRHTSKWFINPAVKDHKPISI